MCSNFFSELLLHYSFIVHDMKVVFVDSAGKDIIYDKTNVCALTIKYDLKSNPLWY